MNAIKRLVKPLYYKLLDIQCVLQRTVFSYFHRLSIPINRHIKIESNVIMIQELYIMMEI